MRAAREVIEETSLKLKDLPSLLSNVELLSEALDNKEIDANCVYCYEHQSEMVERTVVAEASVVGNLEALSLLCRRKANLNAFSKYGNTALHLAVQHRVADSVQFLLSNRASSGIRNESGDTPLRLALLLPSDNIRNRIVSLLYRAGPFNVMPLVAEMEDFLLYQPVIKIEQPESDVPPKKAKKEYGLSPINSPQSSTLSVTSGKSPKVSPLPSPVKLKDNEPQELTDEEQNNADQENRRRRSIARQKDIFGEEFDIGVTEGRKVDFLEPDPDGSIELGHPSVLEWLSGLPSIQPTLGYTHHHVEKLLQISKEVVKREKLKLEESLDNGEIEDWMVALSLVVQDSGPQEALDLFLSGSLYTSDLEYANKKPIQIKNKEILQNHGCTTLEALRTALYFVMNTAMRSIGKDLKGSTSVINVFDIVPTPPQLHVIKSFQPFIAKLQRLISCLPKKVLTVFRGITVNVSSKYRVGTKLVWNAFTSTSVVPKAARAFMDKNGEGGTFFVIVSKEGAADVRFASPFQGEQEFLYTSNIVFQVQWKLSPTLLRMMGKQYDVIVMQQIGKEALHPGEQARAIRDVMCHTLAIFEDYLTEYVEGRVTDDQKVAADDDAKQLLQVATEWLDTDSAGPLCLVGDGGTGKTSAAIAIMSHFMQQSKSEENLQSHLTACNSFHHNSEYGEYAFSEKEVFPIFVALPTIGEKVCKRGGIDSFIQSMFGIEDEGGLAALSQEYRVVVILDSLDEVGLSRETIDNALRGNGLNSRRSILGLHEWCSTNCRVIVTTRNEYLLSVGVTTTQVRLVLFFFCLQSLTNKKNYKKKQVCGEGTKSLYMQHFNHVDAQRYIKTFFGKRNIPVEQNVGWMTGLKNPFLLHMACYSHTSGATEPTETDIYKAFLIKWTSDELRKFKNSKVTPEELLEVGEQLACKMLQTGKWQVVLGDEATRLSKRFKHVALALRCLPLRVEDFNDKNSIVTFRHKTLGEFLAARRLATNPITCLKEEIIKPFSKGAPNIGQYFRSLHDSNVYIKLLELVRDSRDQELSSEKVAAASNSMALLVSSGYTFLDCDLSSIIIRDSDLRRLIMSDSSLKNSKVFDCWLEHSTLYRTDLSHFSCEGSTFGMPLPPLRGHTNRVSTVAIMPDSSSVISGGGDMVLKLWDLSTGKEGRTFEKIHIRIITCVAISPDGKAVVSGSGDNSLRVWNLSDPHDTPKALRGHIDGVTSVVFSSDGNKIVSGGEDRKVILWSLSTGKWQEFEGHTGIVTSVAITSTNDTIISASHDKTVRVWNVYALREFNIFKEHTDGVRALALSPDGTTVVSAGYDKTVRVWDLQSGKEAVKYEGHTGVVSGVAVAPDGTKVVSVSSDRSIRVWDISSGKETLKVDGHLDSITSVAITPSGTQVVSASDDKTLRVWDIATGKEAVKIEGHSRFISSIAISPDGNRVVSASGDSYLQSWDIATSRRLHKLRGHTGIVDAVVITLDSGRIISGSCDKSIRIWSMMNGKECQKLTGHTDGVTSLAISPDGKKIVSGSYDKTIRIWSLSSGKELFKLEGHTDWIRSVAVTFNSSKLVSGSTDRTIRVWDMKTGKPQLTLEGHTDWVTSIALSPDGNKIISGSGDKEILIWNMQSRMVSGNPFVGHTKGVTSVTITPDGSKIISGSGDKTIRVWNSSLSLTSSPIWADIKHEHLQLEGHTGEVSSVAITPNGTKIVSASYDKTIRVWEVSQNMEYLNSLENDSTGGFRVVSILGVPRMLPTSLMCKGKETITPDYVRGLLTDTEFE